MTEEIVFPAATNEESSIVPEGRWTLELLRIEDAPPSNFRPEDGRRFKWVFALHDGPGAPGRFEFNGEPYEFYRFTTKKNSPRATARKYAEALVGKKFEEGYIPKLSEMIGRRMSGVVAYEISEFDSSQTVLKLLSLKSVGSPAPATPAAAPKSAVQVGADATDAEVDRALLVSKIQKKIASAVRLGTPSHLEWNAFTDDDFKAADTAVLEKLLVDATAEVKAATED